MGYECPDRQTTADFLTSVTSVRERIVRPGFESKVPRTPDEFAAYWKNSVDREKLMKEIHSFEQEFQLGGEELALFKDFRKTQQAKYM